MASTTTAVTRDYGKRTAIVTGSARGIGKAIALRLAQDGYDICINDLASNEEEIHATVTEIHSLGRSAYGHPANVTSLIEVENLIQSSVTNLGPLNLMVANAGISQAKSVLDLSEDDVQRMFEVNVYGIFNCYSAAAKQMIRQGGGGGKIVGAASVVAFKPTPLMTHYSASKFAVRGFTQGFAMELAPHSITVNAYAPGIVQTPMWEQLDSQIGTISGASESGETFKRFGEVIALGRTSVPEDVAKCVAFLASPDSDYMTGQTLIIDGGIVFS